MFNKDIAIPKPEEVSLKIEDQLLMDFMSEAKKKINELFVGDYLQQAKTKSGKTVIPTFHKQLHH